MATLKELEDKVKAITDATTAAVALVEGVASELAQLTQDPVAIQRLATDLQAAAKELGAAVLANTGTDKHPVAHPVQYTPAHPAHPATSVHEPPTHHSPLSPRKDPGEKKHKG